MLGINEESKSFPVYRTIEVALYPDTGEDADPNNPYFWMIRADDGQDTYNDGHGWAPTPKAAWDAACEYYQKYKCSKGVE